MTELDKNGKVVVQMEHMTKSFNGNAVLKDVSLEVKKGENLVVLGRSGSGKSVLIKCIVKLVEPDGGKLVVLDKRVRDLDLDELIEMRRRIGFLFQGAALYDSMTVRDNLEFPVRRQVKKGTQKQIKALVEEALENVGLKDAIDKMPSELSGGMRKRVGLARSLILKPEIMLYDEPTTGLDPITSDEISNLILEVQKKYNTTSIIITHDMACAKHTANRIAVLDKGVFAKQGTYDELKESKETYISDFFK